MTNSPGPVNGIGSDNGSTSSSKRVSETPKSTNGLSCPSMPAPAIPFPPRPVSSDLISSAVKIQKMYKNYRTKKICADVVKELWRKAKDFAALKSSSVAFLDVEKSETERTRATKEREELSKLDEKAHKLALQYWLEMIDPRHRYGYNLHMYYDIWLASEGSQPFFYWLDEGDGKEVNLNTCPRIILQCQCIQYFGPDETEAHGVLLEDRKLTFEQRRTLMEKREELWQKALDFAALVWSSVSFFKVETQETAVSRWARARTRAAKVGKGLSEDEKARMLALEHWIEAIDPRHRYGHNLYMYFAVWDSNKSTDQPFIYWLDEGDGKQVKLETCPRTVLQRQCIQYLGLKEREAYEVVVKDGKLMYKQRGALVETVEGSKSIFVLSTSRTLYVGQKRKGEFQHSSFLSGGATAASGRLVVHGGVLKEIWRQSGHYLPTNENIREFIGFLTQHQVDLTDVKLGSIEDGTPAINVNDIPGLILKQVRRPIETRITNISDDLDIFESNEVATGGTKSGVSILLS